MTKCNVEVRAKAKDKKIRLWQVADELGLSDSDLSRKLRYELDDETKAKVLAIIERLK